MKGLGGGEEREIKAWADGIVGHYERKRRTEVLAKARQVIIGLESEGETFLAEVKVEESEVDIIPVQEGDGDVWELDEGGKNVNGKKNHEDVSGEENGWNFGEEEGLINAPAAAPESAVLSPLADDPADAWEWNDEEESIVTEEDDPWAAQIDEPAPAPPPSIPKPATRLEKHSAKGKTNGVSPSPSTATHTPAKILEKGALPPSQLAIKQAPPKETYLVSGRTQVIIRLVEDVISEAREFASSTLFPSSVQGTLISRSALSILDLYRALYPAIFHSALASELAMRFSNDCLYLSEEAVRISTAGDIDGVFKDKLQSCKDSLKILGESWYLDTVVSCHFGNPTFLSTDTNFV